MPYRTYELVKALKENIKVPIQLLSHFTAGIADMVMLKGIEAGVDIIDTALSPLGMGLPPADRVDGGGSMDSQMTQDLIAED